MRVFGLVLSRSLAEHVQQDEHHGEDQQAHAHRLVELFQGGVVGKDGGDLRCDEGGGDAEEHDPQVGLSAQGEVRDSAKQGGEGHNEHTGADGGF